jgi:hypothetical protein
MARVPANDTAKPAVNPAPYNNHTSLQYHPHNVLRRGSQRHVNPDLMGSLHRCIADHTGDSPRVCGLE